MKIIFRYLKGHPKLGLWYPKDSPFELEVYSDSDYAEASLDRKSTTNGCQFLGKMLISWQCKKQTIVANSTTKAEYVIGANCYGQVNDQEQLQALVDKKKVIITEDNIRSDLCFDDAKRTACLLNEAIFEGLARMGLQEQVLDLQEAKAAQAKEIVALKKKVTKLNKWRKLRSGRLRRLKKIGSEIALDDEIQGRTNDDEMFGVDDLAREEVVMDTATGKHEEQIIEDVSTAELVTTGGEVVTTTTVKDSAALTTDVTEDEITMAQALVALKSIKPKVVDKGKAMMIEPEVPIKKKDQIMINEEYARKLEAEEQEACIGFKQEKWKNSLRCKRSFDEIKKLFDKEMRRVNDFIAMDSEAQESCTKRTTEHLESDISKKQKIDKNVEPIIDDSKNLKKCMEIVPDDGDEVLIEATPLTSKSPTIIDYKIHKEGKKTYFKIIRADDRFKKEKPVDDMDNLLFRTLKTMFKHHVKDTIWKYQQGLAKVKNWKLFESRRTKILIKKLEDSEDEYQVYERIVGIKSLQGVTAFQKIRLLRDEDIKYTK
nr:putative ribonuclease H-like domain-containing protein [Tanacetum cinerariifolium]